MMCKIAVCIQFQTVKRALAHPGWPYEAQIRKY